MTPSGARERCKGHTHLAGQLRAHELGALPAAGLRVAVLGGERGGRWGATARPSLLAYPPQRVTARVRPQAQPGPRVSPHLDGPRASSSPHLDGCDGSGDVAGERQDKRQRQLSRRRRVAAGRVHHEDAAAAAGGHGAAVQCKARQEPMHTSATTHRRVASSMSTLSTPTPARPTTRRFLPALSTAGVTFVALSQGEHIGSLASLQSRDVNGPANDEAVILADHGKEFVFRWGLVCNIDRVAACLESRPWTVQVWPGERRFDPHLRYPRHTRTAQIRASKILTPTSSSPSAAKMRASCDALVRNRRRPSDAARVRATEKAMGKTTLKATPGTIRVVRDPDPRR